MKIDFLSGEAKLQSKPPVCLPSPHDFSSPFHCMAGNSVEIGISQSLRCLKILLHVYHKIAHQTL